MIQHDCSVFDVTVLCPSSLEISITAGVYTSSRYNKCCRSLYYNVTSLVACLSVGATRDRTTVGLPVRVGRPCRKTFVLLKLLVSPGSQVIRTRTNSLEGYKVRLKGLVLRDKENNTNWGSTL